MIESAHRLATPSDMMCAAHVPSANTIEATGRELLARAERYVREKPMEAMLWTFGIGFVLGWKLKPW